MRYVIGMRKPGPFVDPKEVIVGGVDMGNGTKPITLHHSLPTNLGKLMAGQTGVTEYEKLTGHAPVLVLKVPGGSHWSRRGDPFVYHAASFKVLELQEIRDDESGRWYICKELIDFPIREEKKGR